MRKTSIFLLLMCFYTYLTAQNGRELEFQKWALTPPMGWNSWDCFGPTVVESEVKENVDYMAEKLLQHGWEYIVVDIRWYVSNDKAGGYNQTNPIYNLDEWGRYVPASNRFPTAVNGLGFKPLADYIHNKGLKFGIHIMRGVPKKAVEERLPIKNGNGKTAADIYSTASQCTWLADNYTILASREGAQEYYNSIFDLYAEWEVDYVKIDDLSRPYHIDEIEMIRRAIDQTGRPIVLSLSPGETPIADAEHVKTHANLWRTVDDFWDKWDDLSYQFTVCHKWENHIGYGSWPDADMLPLGRIGIRAERGVDRMTNFTRDEQYTLMSLWSLFKSPLMFGGHLPSNDAFTDSIITNDEVLYINQKSVKNKQHSNDGLLSIWTAEDPLNGDKFVGMFNLGGDGFVDTRNVIYRSGIISYLTDNHGINIDIELPEGTTELYLVTTDGGDGFSGDHADWINPVFYNAGGDEQKLTNLTWEYATAGWGNPILNKSVGGSTFNINGVTFTNGIGTHPNSVILYQVPEGYTHFKCFAGIDQSGVSQGYGTTVEFMLFNEDPTLREVNMNTAIANSGRISRTMQREGVNLEADITNATKLYLVVTDAGDNHNYDHANWINPTLHKANGETLDLTTISWVNAVSGWDQVKINSSLVGRTLTVNGQTYAKGFGTNSYSYIEFDIPADEYIKFTAFCGYDDEVQMASDGVTMEFLVYTTDPKAVEPQEFTLDLEGLGFSGTCTIRDIWKKENIGQFTGTEYVPIIPQHGVGLYRISAQNRIDGASVSLAPNTQNIFVGDTISLTAIVTVPDGNPTGTIVIMQGEEEVGTIELDETGTAVFTVCGISAQENVFTAQYSGNTIYLPAQSNTVMLNVSANLSIASQGTAYIVEQQGKQTLFGIKPNDQVSFYNASGQLLATTIADDNQLELPKYEAFMLIHIKSGTNYQVLKVLN